MGQRAQQNCKVSHVLSFENIYFAAFLLFLLEFDKPLFCCTHIVWDSSVVSTDNHWLNYWHTSCNKGTSGFTPNTLLIRIQ